MSQPRLYTQILLLSNLEHASPFLLQGWACHHNDPSVTVSLDIHINNTFIARIPAGTFRSDLKASGYGSGYHAFFFNPQDYLTRRENLIEVRESSSSALVANGKHLVPTNLATDRKSYAEACLRARSHWEVDSPAPDAAAEEAAFLQRLVGAAHFHPALRILEIGPGPGNLLRALLKRKKLFSSYLGLDLSRRHVDSLHAEFGGKRISFLAGDASRYPFHTHFDLMVASSVCDALFPSFVPVFTNASRALAPGGIVAFDLQVRDDRNSISRAEWQGDRWLRFYSERELRRLLAQAGLELLQAEIYVKSKDGHHVFVSAMKLPPLHRNRCDSL